MKIESHDRSIRELLGADYYVIPRFQRPYSWDSENVADFWNDVVVNKQADYFIGSMVVYTMTGKLGVVDGQQRLTTIMILLSCLRNSLQTEGFTDQANGLHKLIERENIENQKEFVLQTQTSYPYFQNQVLAQEPADINAQVRNEEERIKSATEQFRRLLSELLESVNTNPALSATKKKNEKKRRLISIRDSILSLKLILVTLDSEEDAYLIFETLNTRGKDLALADLVKNQFTKLIRQKNKALDQVSINWTKIRTTIEGKRELDTDTFIYHWWLSTQEYTAQKNIYKEFRRLLVDEKTARSFLKELETAAAQYRLIHDPDFLAWDKQLADVRASLTALNLFRVRQQVPLTLSLYRAYEDGKIKQSQLIKALAEIEKFHFIFTAVTSQRSSGGISQMYASLARTIYGVENPQAATPILKQITQKLRERVPSESEFVLQFSEIVYTAKLTKERALMKYVLGRIARSSGHPFSADLDDLTIEHLVPQSLIGQSYWDELTVGSAGNLILVTKDLNQKLENKPFKDKKMLLEKNGYKTMLPKEFWDANELTPDMIARRTDSLAALSYQTVWKI